MSIRKRLFISNAAMVLMPIFILILYFILLNVVFRGDFRIFNSHLHQGWQDPGSNNTSTFNQLTKLAALQPKKLSDKDYLDSVSKNLEKSQTGFIIRKGNETLYRSKYVSKIADRDLPVFGKEGYSPVVWFNHIQYSVRQHDFYFKDGAEGTIFFIDKSINFAQFARSYFPLIFFGIVIILVSTNAVLSYFMSRSILRPVRQLSSAAEKISQGNLDFEMKSSSKDELGKLVLSFDSMRKKLKESLELREQFESNRKELIANISHDLKTPITSIKGYVEGIMDGVANTEEKLTKYLRTIHAKSEHMDRLIDELSLYSKLDVKSLPFHFEEVNIQRFMKDYIEELSLENVSNLEVSLVAERSLRVIMDPDKFIRVMNNIVRNSIKYNDKEICKLGINIKDTDKVVQVSIKDNGPGVELAEINRIFHRFYRTDPSRNVKTGGSGLGLAIASQIIEAHGGKIWAESAEGEGLTIHFTLKKPVTEGDNE
ncbi:HAMP domain-containing sensor histidine kinase [Bacillus sp. FJAT-49736]|uniref:sensor histidine kinase n=1 Tax=Bacillus sp. FJAT-49736 TaxID=2833582 RepID=UPI001BCA2B0D|nr:HAMP domain-containing sensor histidine kinase [Bacillus sp. FJAT-49736]MBS4173041.1 HAMP domain-containing histidine kinase [Bacillus sp. FJAT-49736]